MCARPFMPPPPRTRMNRVSLFTGIAACPEGELPSNVVVAPMPALLIRHRIMRSRWTIAGLAVVAALACAALLAPWLAPRDPYHGALSYGLRPPSPAYLFGTDAQGRDVLSRVVFGAWPGAGGARARLRAGRARARCIGRPPRVAPYPAQRARPGDHRGDARRRRRHHGRGGAVVPRAGRAAAHAVVGRDGGGGTRPAARGTLGVAISGARDRRRRDGTERAGRR